MDERFKNGCRIKIITQESYKILTKLVLVSRGNEWEKKEKLIYNYAGRTNEGSWMELQGQDKFDKRVM